MGVQRKQRAKIMVRQHLVRCSEEQDLLVRRAAARDEREPAVWIRMQMVRAAQRVLKKH